MAGLGGRENTLTRDLPGGWRQRLALGCAILHEPQIVFLDEPTGGVDPLSRRRFWDLIGGLSRDGVTVLVTTHYLDEAEHCHRIAIIQAGQLAALGTTTELKQTFADRPIVEIHASKPVEAMAILDRARSRREDQLVRHRRPCGAERPVHRSGSAVIGAARTRASTSPRSAPSRRRSKTCSSTWSNDWGRRRHRWLSRSRGRVMKKAMAVASKELRQILRDRRTLLILLFVPAFFLLLFGYALNFDIRNVRLAVQDQDRSTRSRELVSSFVNSGYFSLVGYVDSPAEMDRLVDEGQVRAILSIPPGFDRDLSIAQAGDRAGDHRRRQREHRRHRDGLLAHVDWRVQLRADAGGSDSADRACRRSPSSRASGTTRSCAARCSWCPG